MSWTTPTAEYQAGYVANLEDDTVVVSIGEGIRWTINLADSGQPRPDVEASFEKLVDAIAGITGFTVTGAGRSLSSSQNYTP